MESDLYTTRESDQWTRAMEPFMGVDVYHTPEFHRCHELNGDGIAYAYFAHEAGQSLFYSFFLRPIESIGGETVIGDWTDIETVYGYSGPLSTTTEKAFLESAWGPFNEWCRDHRVVAEFCRFNPLSSNHVYAPESMKVGLERETVAVHLEGSEEDLWSRYSSTQRNMIRKAIRNGLTCEEVSLEGGLPEFTRLYGATMDRLDASRFYRFSQLYFQSIDRLLGDGAKLFWVRLENRVVAAALFFCFGDRIHYHLAGSEEASRPLAANNLLLHAVALWGRENGMCWFHLGGGRSSDPNDSLFRFKAGFSSRRLPFMIGSRLHNRPAYDTLCGEWMRRNGAAKRPDRFLLYRL